jgi:hypothetical protein
VKAARFFDVFADTGKLVCFREIDDESIPSPEFCPKQATAAARSFSTPDLPKDMNILMALTDGELIPWREMKKRVVEIEAIFEVPVERRGRSPFLPPLREPEKAPPACGTRSRSITRF